MQQRQAIVTVRLVLLNDETLEEAQDTICSILEEAEVMANVRAERIVVVEAVSADQPAT